MLFELVSSISNRVRVEWCFELLNDDGGCMEFNWLSHWTTTEKRQTKFEF